MTATLPRTEFAEFCRTHKPPIHFEFLAGGMVEIRYIVDSPELFPDDSELATERKFTYETNPIGVERMAYARGRRGE